MTALAIDPFDSGHVMYGTGSGIWRSKDAHATDSGGTSHWTVGARGLEETAVLDVIAPPGGATAISSMGDLGGFRYDSLTEVPAGRLKNPMMITSTDIDFAQSNPAMMVRVGRGGEQDGAYSTDGGSSWNGFRSEPVGSADSGQVALAADGSAIVWTEAGQAPYRSTDRGASWSRVSGLGNGAVVVADRSSARTFYSLADGTLHASTDGGATFTARATNLPSGKLTAVPGIAGDLWISGGGKGLLHSTDGGRTFTTLGAVQSASALGFGKAAPGSLLPGPVPDRYRQGRHRSLPLHRQGRHLDPRQRRRPPVGQHRRHRRHHRRPRHLRPRLCRHQRTRPPVRRPVLTPTPEHGRGLQYGAPS